MTTLSNFPGGFNSGVSLRNVPLYEVFGNNVYWVSSSTGLNGNNGTRN